MNISSFDRFGEVATFDPRSGLLEKFSRPPDTDNDIFTDGHYSLINDQMVVFFRAESGELALWVAGQSFPISESSVLWRREQDRSVLSVRRRLGEGVELSYQPDLRQPYDMTPFVDDEDDDFGLFIWRIVGDTTRSSRMYRKTGPHTAR